MESIEYHHEKNSHNQRTPAILLSKMLEGQKVNSLVDVGAGVGTWVAAALEINIPRVRGIDGILVDRDALACPPDLISQVDFRASFDLGERFDVALCLEVAEHLEERNAEVFVSSLVNHADAIFFSAAIPGQNGENHVNCQWPEYWQNLFNRFGYECSDNIRWKLWNCTDSEPWYRQNMMTAVKSERAGQESRISPVIHPEMLKHLATDSGGPESRTRLRKVMNKVLGFR